MPRHALDYVPTDLGPFDIDPAKPMARQLYEAVRDKILTMHLKPGDAVSEIDLANATGSSRSPARQAIKQLVLEHLLISFPSRGTFVAPLDLGRLNDALFIRAQLEPEIAARCATAPGNSATLEALGEIVSQQRKALEQGKDKQAEALDGAFHFTLCGAQEDSLVWRVLRDARAEAQRLHALSKVRDKSMEIALTHHEAILSALRSGDGEVAAAAMTAHMADNKRALEQIIQTFPDYFVTESTT